MADDQERYRQAATALRTAERNVRVLRSIAWAPEVGQAFLAGGGDRMPVVEYEPFDPAPAREALATARSFIGDDGVVDRWLARVADDVEGGIELLCAVGTPGFHEASRRLYGAPDDLLVDGSTTPLDLARRLQHTLADLSPAGLGVEDPPTHDADELASRMRAAVRRYLGEVGPEIEVVDHLGANVIAGPSRVRIRSGATFSDHDVLQLIHHEILVHVMTSLNGRAQEAVPILAAAHPGTTRTQEGLAVFAELITGSMDPDRFRRLGDRVLAIQLATDGANFIEVFRFFCDRGIDPEQAFENTRRVFRGTPLTGGYPFTKDSVYLDGLLRVHNFLRVAILAGRVDCIELLFCGKIDIEDIPAIAELAAMGLVERPSHLPPWAADRRPLVAYLAFSGFLDQVDLAQVSLHYAVMLAASTRLD